jgi:hypothetical protein
VDRYDYPLVARERRRALIGHREDDMERFRLGHLGRGEEGFDPGRVLDLERSPGAGVGYGECAGFAVVDPFIGQHVAVGIAGTFGAEIDALAISCAARGK